MIYVWLLGLALPLALWACYGILRFVDSRRCRNEAEARVRTLGTSSTWQGNAAGPIHYGLSYPNIPKPRRPYQRPVR